MAQDILNNEGSLMQARWCVPDADHEIVARMARRYDLPEIVARLLTGRGVPEQAVEEFLYPTLAKHFPDPLSMAGMKDMAAFMAGAIADKRPIGIFGDFDVDGATSTAILVRFFRHLGLNVPFYIPDRLKEGYGPNVGALQSLKEQGAEIVIICDCGITSFDVVAQGKELGLDIIIFDHHEAEDSLPTADHVIDPKRQDDESGLDMLAACGVSFLACVAINKALRERGFYKNHDITEPPLKDWLDIVALGTVCDMVPLSGPNRLFVRYGFERMVARQNQGIKALLEVAGVTGDPSPYHAGFVMGPRINAGSRVHKSDLGAQLLVSDDFEAARNIAFTLNDCNDMRKEIQAEMTDQAIHMAESEGLADKPVIIVGHENWHSGLSGLVAGRLKEKYDKPAIVTVWTHNELGEAEGRGSGRSVPGVNMGAAFIDARQKGLLIKGGGHAMAAGFTVAPDQFEAFKAFLYDHIGRQLTDGPALSETMIDAVLSVHGAQPDFVKIIHEYVGPFGQENPEPVFALMNVRLHMVDVVGADHIRAMISDWEGGPRLKAIAFRAKDTPLGQAMLKHGSNTPFHVAGSFKIDNWNGQERVEMHIQDALPVMKASAAQRQQA